MSEPHNAVSLGIPEFDEMIVQIWPEPAQFYGWHESLPHWQLMGLKEEGVWLPTALTTPVYEINVS